MTRIGLLVFLGLAAAPGAHGQGWSTYSTAAYGAVPVSVGLTEGVGLKSAATTASYSYLTLASYKMHTAEKPIWYTWEQIDLDATVLAAATVAADAWEPIVGDWAWGSLAPVAGYYLLTEQKPVIYPKDPILHTALWTGIAFTGLALTEGWKTLFAAIPMAIASYIRIGLDADENNLHGVWHATSALSAGVALNLDNFDLGFR